jgi:hypothetical protein
MRLLAAALLAASSMPAHAQGSVELSGSGGSTTVRNGLPRPVLVLVRDDGSSTIPRFVVVDVPARGSASIPAGVTRPALQRFEMMAGDVTRRTPPASACARKTGDGVLPAIQQLEREYQSLRMEGSAEAEAAIEIATELAQLRFARIRDSLSVLRSDPVELAARQMYLRDATPQQRAAARDEESQEDLNATIAEVGLAAFAYAEAAEAKYAILERDAEAAKAKLESMEQAVTAFKGKRSALTQLEQAQGKFEAMLVRSIDEGAVESPALEGVVAVDRACDAPPDVSDDVDVTVSADSRLATLILAADFNEGGRREFVVRRVKGTDRFTGQVQWPTTASQASVKVRAPGSREFAKRSFTLKTGRDSFATLESKLEKRLAAARKNYKGARFRAEGGDHIKAVILP